MRSSVVVAVASLCLTCSAVAAEAATSQSESATHMPTYKSTELRELIAAVGKKMHKHFLVDPRAPQTVDLGSLSEEEVTYPLLRSILNLYGYAVETDGSALLVVPDSNARQYPSPVLGPDSIRAEDDEWITTVVPLKNVSSAQLVPILRPMMPQNGQLSAAVGRNALIIVDRSANARRLIEVARTIDNLPPSKVAEPPRVTEGGSERSP